MISQDDTFKNEISKSDYVIYIYMYNHITRFFDPSFINPEYKGVFEPTKTEKFLNKFQLTKYIMIRLKQKGIMSDFPNTEKTEEFLKEVITRWYKEVKKSAPKAKVIIILYDEKMPDDNYDENSVIYYIGLMNNSLWNDI